MPSPSVVDWTDTEERLAVGERLMKTSEEIQLWFTYLLLNE